MSQAQSQVLSAAIEDAAYRAVYQLQYNSAAAASYVRGEVPGATYELAIATINRIVRPQKKVKSA